MSFNKFHRGFPLLILALSCLLKSDALISESLIGLGAIGMFASYSYLWCPFTECCFPESKWITPNMTLLRESFRQKLYGQHLVEDVVIHALLSHYEDSQPKKALVLSLHGDTGVGKNFVADMIANALYRKGTDSKYVHKFIATIDFPHDSKVDLYKLHLIDTIRNKVQQCERTLFIFDEVHKLPNGLIDSIKPFIDYHEQINGVDYRKAVFLFLSNTGTKSILRFALDWWSEGKEREDIKRKDIEHLVQNGAFNERGGLHMSELIEHSLVDFYVPFLPMERQHVQSCIKDEFRSRKRIPSENLVQEVANEIVYFPSNNPLYATKGCKNVYQKVMKAVINAYFSD